MKITLSFLLIMSSLLTNAQTKNITKIDKANTVNIYNGKVAIGQVNITATLKPKLILQSVTQQKDTANTYKTVFLFSNPEGLPFFNVNIGLSFDKPVMKAFPSYNGTATMTSEGYNTEYTAYQFKATQVTSESLSLVVVSKTPIFTKLYGIDGISGQ